MDNIADPDLRPEAILYPEQLGSWRFIQQSVNPLGLRKSGDRKFTDISPVVLAQAGAYPAGQPHSGDIQ